MGIFDYAGDVLSAPAPSGGASPLTDGVTWVAIAALALSLVNAVVSAVQAWRKRSRLVVTVGSSGIIDSSGSHVSFTVTVLNPGRGPVTVYDLGLSARHLDGQPSDHPDQPAEVSYRHERFTEKVLRKSDADRDEPPAKSRATVDGRDVPLVLGAQEVAEWEILDAATSGYGEDTKWRGWASRLRTNGKEKRSTSRKTDQRRPFWHDKD